MLTSTALFFLSLEDWNRNSSSHVHLINSHRTNIDYHSHQILHFLEWTTVEMFPTNSAASFLQWISSPNPHVYAERSLITIEVVCFTSVKDFRNLLHLKFRCHEISVQSRGEVNKTKWSDVFYSQCAFAQGTTIMWSQLGFFKIIFRPIGPLHLNWIISCNAMHSLLWTR